VTHAPAIASYDVAAANMTPEVGHGLRTTSAPQCALLSPGAHPHASTHHHADSAPAADAPTAEGDNADADEAALNSTTRETTCSDDTHRTRITHQAAQHHQVLINARSCHPLPETRQHWLTLDDTIQHDPHARGLIRTHKDDHSREG
jgi:hypothetical protein